MIKYEIFEILRSFSPAEIQKFGRFLLSPYFGERPKLAKLYREIVKYYPLFTHVNLSKRNLSKNVFPKTVYKDSTMRNHFSDLQEAAKRFMSFENFGRSKQDKYNYLFSEFKRKNLNDEFWKTLEKTSGQNEGLADWVYFLNGHFTDTNCYNFSHHNKKLRREKDMAKELGYLNSSVNNLIYFFVLTFTSIFLNYLTYRKSYNADALLQYNIEKVFSMLNIPQIKALMHEDKNSFILDIYSALLTLFSEPGKEENYFKFKEIFLSNIGKISRDEISFLYHQMITYSYLRLGMTDNSINYETELFDQYAELLEKRYYLDRNTNHLPHESFRTILMHALRLKKFEWTEQFVDTYSLKVHPEDKENMYNYGHAYLAYNLGDYEKAMSCLKKIEKDYFVYKIDSKNLLLMIYYELGHTEEALNLLKTHLLSLRSNKLIESGRRKRYINFSKFLEKLIFYNAGTLRQELGYVKHQLLKHEAVAFKPWLLERIAQCTPGRVKAV